MVCTKRFDIAPPTRSVALIMFHVALSPGVTRVEEIRLALLPPGWRQEKRFDVHADQAGACARFRKFVSYVCMAAIYTCLYS